MLNKNKNRLRTLSWEAQQEIFYQWLHDQLEFWDSNAEKWRKKSRESQLSKNGVYRVRSKANP